MYLEVLWIHHQRKPLPNDVPSVTSFVAMKVRRSPECKSCAWCEEKSETFCPLFLLTELESVYSLGSESSIPCRKESLGNLDASCKHLQAAPCRNGAGRRGHLDGRSQPWTSGPLFPHSTNISMARSFTSFRQNPLDSTQVLLLRDHPYHRGTLSPAVLHIPIWLTFLPFFFPRPLITL